MGLPIVVASGAAIPILISNIRFHDFSRRQEEVEIKMLLPATTQPLLSERAARLLRNCRCKSSFFTFCRRILFWKHCGKAAHMRRSHAHVLKPLHFSHRIKALLRPSTNANLCYLKFDLTNCSWGNYTTLKTGI